MTAPVVVILAAGQGTRMRSAVQKLLHPLCGRPIIDWPIAAAREAGAGEGRGRRLAGATAGVSVTEGWCWQSRSGPSGRPMPSGGRRPDRARRHGDRAQRRCAADHAESLRGAGREPRPLGRGGHDRDDGARGPARLRPSRARARRHGGAGGRDQGSRRRLASWSCTSGRSTPGLFAFDGGALIEALAEVRADNAQGEHYLPDVLPILRGTSGPSLAFELTDPDETARDQRSLPAGRRHRSRPAPDPRAPHARRGDDRQPGRHGDRRGGDDRPGRRDRPVHQPARHDHDRRRARRSDRMPR